MLSRPQSGTLSSYFDRVGWVTGKACESIATSIPKGLLLGDWANLESLQKYGRVKHGPECVHVIMATGSDRIVELTVNAKY